MNADTSVPANNHTRVAINLVVTHLSVRSDSRCPPRAIWCSPPGEATLGGDFRPLLCCQATFESSGGALCEPSAFPLDVSDSTRLDSLSATVSLALVFVALFCCWHNTSTGNHIGVIIVYAGHGHDQLRLCWSERCKVFPMNVTRVTLVSCLCRSER